MTLIEEAKRAMAKVAKDESGLTLTTFTMDNMAQAASRAVLLAQWKAADRMACCVFKNQGATEEQISVVRSALLDFAKLHQIDLTEKAG